MDITEDNYQFYCAKFYDNRNCFDVLEFNNDIMIPIHIRKLLSKYKQTGILKERLVINHLICLFNVFDPLAATKILFFKIDREHHENLKTILVFLGRCPDFLKIGEDDLKDIRINHALLKTLEKIV